MMLLRIGLLVISLLISLGPIFYALYSYDWHVDRLVMPIYTPPRVGFDVKYRGANVSGLVVYAQFEVRNTGDLGVRVEDIQGAAYDPATNRSLGTAKLLEAVELGPSSSSIVNMVLNIDRDALPLLFQSIMSTDSINFILRGSIQASTLGVRAALPINMQIRVSSNELPGLKQPIKIALYRVDVESIEYGKVTLSMLLNVTNSLDTEISISKIYFDIYDAAHGVLLGSGRLVSETTIPPRSSSQLKIEVVIEGSGFDHLIREHLAGGKISLTVDLVNGSVSARAYNFNFTAPLEIKGIKIETGLTR